MADRLFAICAGSLRAHEYDWHRIIGAGQLFLKFQAVNSRQLHVDDQASSFPGRSRLQKLLGRTETLNYVSRRLHTVFQRLTHEHVIVYHRDVSLQCIHPGQQAVPRFQGS